jgi:hypothetical protein
MIQIRSCLFLAVVALATSCTPFSSPPDAGNGSRDGDGASESPPSSADGASESSSSTSDIAEASTGGSGALGSACAGPQDCKSVNCAEGVCCDTTCGDKCTSCLKANSGQSDGTCAPVKAGLAHGADCTATDPTTCGLDGRCDGAGACRNHGAGTMCAPESCTDGAQISSHQAPRICDGHGVCIAAAASDCGSAYRCMGTKCRTTCASPPDCVPADYCAGTACVPKKSDGALCASAAECAKGVCGGRCCAAGCTCTEPNVMNLLKNPGFDLDAGDWMITVGVLSRSLSDIERCPYSGSLTTAIDAGGDERLISQCVSNTPLTGDFNFGARVEVLGGNPPPVVCQATFFSGFNCGADAVAQGETDGGPRTSGWQTLSGSLSSANGTSVNGANSVSYVCYLRADPSFQTTFQLDMLYVSRSPALY